MKNVTDKAVDFVVEMIQRHVERQSALRVYKDNPVTYREKL